ncbi:MAG: hypothetical protein GYB66_00880 [Chloroflexi bacterium]|nr:hypothetical protein [Chloroflexota bacterium]
MTTIALVAGSKSQQKVPALSQLLYRTPLFQKTSLYVEQHYERWYILSAKYGLLEPDTVIEPYSLSFHDLSRDERFRWARRVIERLSHQRIRTHDTIAIFAGKHFQEFLIPVMEGRRFNVTVPLSGMNAAQQLRWLEHALQNENPE